MSDEEEAKVETKVEYTDLDEPEECNWIKRAGKAKVTYPNQDSFEGIFNQDKLKEGYGVYVWMGVSTSEENEGEVIEVARYEGNYSNGLKNGIGKMVYTNKDTYEGQWVDDKMEGEGSYTYFKSQDIYSGTWKQGKKDGKGRYEFAKDKSMLAGEWNAGQLVTGKWEMKGYGVFEGSFENQKPIGPATYKFVTGMVQKGEYLVDEVEAALPAEGDEAGEEAEPTNDDATKARSIQWKPHSIVRF